MSLAEKQHGHAGLTDTAAHGERQLVIQQHLMERQLAAVIAAGDAQLTVEAFGIYADTHGGKLHGSLTYTVPYKQVAIERPIVIVGGASVMRFAGAELAADADNEGDGVLLDESIFAALAVQLGIKIFKLLAGNKGDLVRYLRQNGKLGEYAAEELLSVSQRGNDGAHGLLEILGSALLGGDYLLPIPLVYIGGVEAVQILIAADCVHVRIKTLTDLELIALESKTLPLCKGVNDLRGILDAVYVESDGALDAVEVVVETRRSGYEKGSGYSVKTQCARKIILKKALEQADGSLCFIYGKQRGVTLGKNGSLHCNSPII